MKIVYLRDFRVINFLSQQLVCKFVLGWLISLHQSLLREWNIDHIHTRLRNSTNNSIWICLQNDSTKNNNTLVFFFFSLFGIHYPPSTVSSKQRMTKSKLSIIERFSTWYLKCHSAFCCYWNPFFTGPSYLNKVETAS